jgi:hypothetical protein
VAERVDRGASLLLLPAGMLVVLVLASIAVDLSVAYLGQRELAVAAAAAANDAATAALDPSQLRAAGRSAPDLVRAERIVREAIDVRGLDVTVTAVEIEIVDARRIRVRVRGEIDLVFADAVPGVGDTMTVAAVATGHVAVGLS